MCKCTEQNWSPIKVNIYSQQLLIWDLLSDL